MIQNFGLEYTEACNNLLATVSVPMPIITNHQRVIERNTLWVHSSRVQLLHICEWAFLFYIIYGCSQRFDAVSSGKAELRPSVRLLCLFCPQMATMGITFSISSGDAGACSYGRTSDSCFPSLPQYVAIDPSPILNELLSEDVNCLGFQHHLLGLLPFLLLTSTQTINRFATTPLIPWRSVAVFLLVRES